MRQMIVPVILAGGSGERLWPLSKVDYPKQFIAFEEGNHSLFQDTLARVTDRTIFAPPVVVCNEEHRFIVAEQLRASACGDATLIVEPFARNTAPALALAALHITKTSGDAVMFAMPSDHRIHDAAALVVAVQRAARAARDGWIVTFAIPPDTPETGYGYIDMGRAIPNFHGLYAIAKFTEKPDMATALAYIAQGGYGWNSGMFVMDCATLLGQFKSHAPAVLERCTAAYDSHSVDQTFIRPSAPIMQVCPSISIDYAVMEHTDRGAVIPVDIGWSDLGSWAALDGETVKDAHGNARIGRTVTHDVQGCYIRGGDSLVAAIGLRDMVVIASDNAIMVGPKDRMGEVKSLLQQMRDAALPDTHLTSFAHRPWGGFTYIDRDPHYQVKKLQLKPGGKISLQSHARRSEHWVVVKGTAIVTCDGTIFALQENESTHIPAGATHRLENAGESDLIVIEVQTGAYLGEDDIQRFEDAYQRD